MPTFDAPQSPIEAILQNMLGANNTLRETQSRNEALLLQILDAMQHGGGDVTAEAVLAAITDMDEYEAATALAALGGVSRIDLSAYELKPTQEYPTGSAVTITPAANTIYNCGELTSLTISNPTASGAYSVVFTSGSTATVTTIPATILGLENFAAEANTIYEINVLDNRAVVGSWAVSA